jgi:hypothetical protein
MRGARARPRGAGFWRHAGARSHACAPACAQVYNFKETEGHDGPSPHEATINYTLSDCGTHYTITPRCYFDTKGKKAKVKVNSEDGRMSIRPARMPKTELDKYGVTKFIAGGYLFLPKKCDLTKEPTIRHVGPVGQLLVIDFPKKPEFQTQAKFIESC